MKEYKIAEGDLLQLEAMANALSKTFRDDDYWRATYLRGLVKRARQNPVEEEEIPWNR